MTEVIPPAHHESILKIVLDWLRKGYPEGIPPKDRFPLIAILRHRLTDAELDHVVSELIHTGQLPADREQISAAITTVVDQPPNDDDIMAVTTRLREAGWPLAPDSSPAAQTSSKLANLRDLSV